MPVLLMAVLVLMLVPVAMAVVRLVPRLLVRVVGVPCVPLALLRGSRRLLPLVASAASAPVRIAG